VTPEQLLSTFYRIPRLSAAELSDGGGPFGFDIHTALAVDYLITRYDCDAIIETGCNRGDTTQYLAEAYPDRVVLSCDIVPQYVDFVRKRLAEHHNVAIDQCDSPELLQKVRGQFRCPLYYLDAHWYDAWPLTREL
jgi:spermidine synthase